MCVVRGTTDALNNLPAMIFPEASDGRLKPKKEIRPSEETNGSGIVTVKPVLSNAKDGSFRSGSIRIFVSRLSFCGEIAQAYSKNPIRTTAFFGAMPLAFWKD